MTTTAKQVFDLAADLIDERSDSGVVSAGDTVSYAVKAPGILTMLQSELIKQGDIFKTYEISNKPVLNLLGNRTHFDVLAFEGSQLTFECQGSARAYYFEVDRVGTVNVEDYNGAWNTLATIETTNTPSGFTAYKGVVTPSEGATRSRLRFGGSYYYRTVNRALFAVPFAVDADVPDYRPFFKHQMPADFKSVNEIINETAEYGYIQDAGYKWEGRRDLYIDYHFDGNIRIVYRPVPAIITALTDIMQLDDVAARTILPYGLATHLMLEENPAIASYFNGRFDELKRDANKQPPASFEKITDVYRGFDQWL